MSKFEFIALVNQLSSAIGRPLDLTEENVVRYDERVVIDVPLATVQGHIRADFDRVLTERMVSDFGATLVAAAMDELGVE